jgi:hypothetical protein
MKIVISTPSNRDWKGQFGSSLFRLSLFLEKNGVSVYFRPWFRTSNLAKARQGMVEEALGTDATHILFVDDDMFFTNDAFTILKRRNVDFVGANCVKRGVFTSPSEMMPLEPTAIDLNGKPCYSANKNGMEKISLIGLGFTLAKLSIFKNLQPPYFEMRAATNIDTNKRFVLPEDHYLCHRLRESGVDVYVDHDAARHVAHIGDYFYQEKF